MVISRRKDAAGKMRNSEPLTVSLTNRAGEPLIEEANAVAWEDFLFHLGPVVPREKLHQADRDLRSQGTAVVEVNDRIVDELWVQSFLLDGE